MSTSLRATVVALGALLLTVPAAAGQSVLERTPNLSGGWIGLPGQVYFTFLHRFGQTGPPTRKVSSSPTFLLAAPLHERFLAGVRYATNSDLITAIPNEWEFLGRVGLFRQDDGKPLDVSVQAGYNLAAESVDGELALVRRIGPVRLLAAGRAFSDGYGAGEARFALGGGASLQVLESLALAGDIASLLDRTDDEPLAWSAGVQWAIPYTPHTLSLHASSVNTTTLQGASRGAGRIRYGFEFTIPITLRRFLPAPDQPAVAAAPADTAVKSAGNTFSVPIQNLAYGSTTIEVPVGATVVWTNDDPVPHTVTADDGAFDSGVIAPGDSWSRTFEQAGSYAYHCTPHPFMKANIVVR